MNRIHQTIQSIKNCVDYRSLKKFGIQFSIVLLKFLLLLIKILEIFANHQEMSGNSKLTVLRKSLLIRTSAILNVTSH